MNIDETEYVYKELAGSYDRQVREYNSYAHDVIFGMSFEYVKTSEKLIDIGIGTGLASIKFARLGLKVYGLDSSQEMLDECKSKSFAEELQLFDLTSSPIPYADNCFDHAVCCGVMHFFGSLDDLFKEVTRVTKPGGIFSFTIAPHDNEEPYLKENTAWGVPIFRHSPQYIMKLLSENGYEPQKEQRLIMKGADKVNFDMLFSAFVVC
jgi:ubiquinone/menaquinone biosynthesis C-methylase UbiE